MTCACINECFYRFIWSSLHLATVNSVGTRLREDRSYNKFE